MLANWNKCIQPKSMPCIIIMTWWLQKKRRIFMFLQMWVNILNCFGNAQLKWMQINLLSFIKLIHMRCFQLLLSHAKTLIATKTVAVAMHRNVIEMQKNVTKLKSFATNLQLNYLRLDTHTLKQTYRQTYCCKKPFCNSMQW